MEIIELVKVLKVTRGEIIEKIDFLISYSLLRIKLYGCDEIDGVGKITLGRFRGKARLVIDLEPRWKKLLDGEDVAQELVESLSKQITDRA